MEENRTGFIAWVKEHKKQLILSGVGVTAIIVVILGIKNRNTIMELWASLEEGVKKTAVNIPDVTAFTESLLASDVVTTPHPYTSSQIPFNVNRHIRTLSECRHPSDAKVVEAIKYEIDLLPNQTWVDSYVKRVA